MSTSAQRGQGTQGAAQGSGWRYGGVSWREYVDMRIDELEKRGDQRAAMALSAIAERTAQLDTRLQGMNEFRNQLREQAGTFATVDKMDSLVASLRDRMDLQIEATERLVRELASLNAKRIESLEQFRANILGRISVIAGVAVASSALVSALLRFLH